MTLDMDCMRDILIAIEEKPFRVQYTLSDLTAKLPGHSEDALWYTCLKLDEAGMLYVYTVDSLGCPVPQIIAIGELTFQGHELLEKIRDPKQYRMLRKVLGAAQNFSLAAVSAASEGVTAALIHDGITGLFGS